MNDGYRLSKNDLLEVLKDWDSCLSGKILLVACGGTALTLLNYKESTRDVDFLIPNPKHYDSILSIIDSLGYKNETGNGYRHPNKPWIFDLFRGQTVFVTELLDPVQEKGNHRVIKEYTRLTLGCLNPEDLIISKMFRGTGVDVDDSIILLKAEKIDLAYLAQRYKDTGDYYYNPPSCKKNLSYLISEMENQKMDTTPLKEMWQQWNA